MKREVYTPGQAMAMTRTSTLHAALRKANENRHGRKRFTYMPHVGEKQRRKGRLRILAQLTDIPMDGGIRRGFTGLQMVQRPELADFVKANPEIFTTTLNMDAAIVIEAEQREAA